jgi:hypothetical protein
MMRSSVSVLSSAASGWSTTGTVAMLAASNGAVVARGTAATPFLRNDRSRFDCARRAQRLPVIVAALLRVFHARLALANSPSGRSPASQDTASAYEIALGVVSGSLLPDAVTRVT